MLTIYFLKEFPVYDNSEEHNENKEGDSDDEEKESDLPLSKKKMKKVQRLTVAELKQLVKKPEAVEVIFNYKCNITFINSYVVVGCYSYRSKIISCIKVIS